ncbi:unnamed protein product [Echinostoma caproni]|uniref:Ig-like domain-containing protein n=1 Tax=Echinostoma caproni TaxID=27848 RepID=A0A183AAN2_9TREM|nr:unnamed protein product [Echinostoma caproni]
MILSRGRFDFGRCLMWHLTFVLVACVTVFQCYSSAIPETKLYSIQFRLQHKSDEVDVQCPLQYAKSGDELLIYERKWLDNSTVLIRRSQITEHTKARDLTLTVRRWTERSQFECVLHSPQTNTVVYRTEVRFSQDKGYRQLVYDPDLNVRIEARLGRPFSLNCPISNHNNEKILWFQHAGYEILHAEEDGTLQFNTLGKEDLGTYYCTLKSDARRAELYLPVRKVLLTSEGQTQSIKPVSGLLGRDSADIYYCSGLPRLLTQITWENPMGSVWVGYNQQTIKRSKSIEQLAPSSIWCSFDAYEELDASESNVTVPESDRPLVRTRRSVHVGPAILVMPRRDSENSTVLLKCDWKGPVPEGQTLMFRWVDPQNGTVADGKEIYRELQMFGAMSDADALHNSISCEVTSKEQGEVIGSTSMSLAPVAVRTIGSVDLAQIPKRVYGYGPGESVEMVCRVEREFVETGKDIQWTFNGGPIPEGLNRIDRIKASILLTNDLQPQHEGHYVCHMGEKTLQVQLIQRPVTLGLGTEPESDTCWANAGESTEFHCRLSGRENGNQLIDWSFIPKGSEDEVLVHPDVNIERPAATPATSFISIHNVQKYHEGTYVCRALNMKAISELIVKTRSKFTFPLVLLSLLLPLSVNPEQLDARPGTTVRFLCELSAVSGHDGGKLYWMRTDRKDLRPGKEEVIGSTGGRALLIVHSVDWSDHNTTYMCTDGVSSAESRIFVREACGPGYRSCESGGCVASSAFCDGKQDCEDGTDEDPTRCNECSPNELRCGDVGDKKPLRNCYLQYWRCDGEDDCGNNFDEENCPGVFKNPYVTMNGVVLFTAD